jgi:hypothetical protein
MTGIGGILLDIDAQRGWSLCTVLLYFTVSSWRYATCSQIIPIYALTELTSLYSLFSIHHITNVNAKAILIH